MATNADSVITVLLGMINTVEVPVISAAMPDSTTPASRAAAAPSTVPTITGVLGNNPVAFAASSAIPPSTTWLGSTGGNCSGVTPQTSHNSGDHCPVW